jgi:hypothetical protein
MVLVLVLLFEYSSQLQKKTLVVIEPHLLLSVMWARWISGESGGEWNVAQSVSRLRVILCYEVLFVLKGSGY